MRSGVGLGLVTGILLIVFVGWIPLAGPFVAGFVSGLHTRDKREGVLSGFITGSVGSIILAWIFYIALLEFFVVAEGLFVDAFGTAINAFYALGPIVLIIEVIAFATLGGALGAQARERWTHTGRRSVAHRR